MKPAAPSRRSRFPVSLGIVAIFFPVWLGGYLGDFDLPVWGAFILASAAVAGMGLYRSVKRSGVGGWGSVIGLALTLAAPFVYNALFASFRR